MKVYVDDVDAHFAHAKAAGARIVSEPQDGFWAAASIARSTTKAIAGRSRSAAAISPRSAGSCRPA
jgi:hypothetical protein